MNLLITFSVAIRALAKNKMRACLTVLGVVIGIAAVTTMVSLGLSASQLVASQFESLGTNVIVIAPARQQRNGVRQGTSVSLTASDSEAIVRDCSSVIAASPLVFTSSQVIYGNVNWGPKDTLGVGAEYLTVRNWSLRHGGFFSRREIASSAKVCVIGHTLVAKLFQTTNPLGETIRLNKIPLEVIGVLEKKGSNIVGEDQDDILLMPYTTMQKRVSGSVFNNVHLILASALSTESMAIAKNDVFQVLIDRHHIRLDEDPDFVVQDTTEIAAVLGIITGTMTLMLASIAGISLLVGGVGIMNTMLVSVTERTREIGIRMAVGAESKHILWQFLVESIVLSSVGGVIGLGLGVAGSIGIVKGINSISSGADWPVVISLPAAIVAILFAAAVGVFFGFYPAYKASRLDPIDALRYE